MDDVAVHVLGVDRQRHRIGILHAVDGAAQLALFVGQLFLQVGLEGSQVIGGFLHGAQGVDQVIHHGLFVDRIVLMWLTGEGIADERRQQGAHVHFAGLQRQRVGGQGILLHGIDVGGHAVGHSEDQRNADDTDGARKGSQQGAALFADQVLQRQAKGGREGHGGLLFLLRAGNAGHAGVTGLLLDDLQLLGSQRHGVTGDLTVQHADGTGSILFRQLRIMGNHDDQTILSHFLQDVHDLHAGLGVQCAGGLIRQDDVGIVHQRTGNGHALHLAAGHLGGLLAQLIAQTYILQHLDGPLAALRLGHAGQGQGDLDVLQHGLMGDQVVALEYKANGMVAVCVPVAILVMLGRGAVDDQVTFGVLIQATDDIQHGGLAAAGGAEDGHKLILAEGQVDPLEGMDNAITGRVILFDAFEL